MRIKVTMLLVVFSMFLFAGIDARAQDRTITGTVTSAEDMSPLPGVTIRVKNTNQGTTTNSEGEYSITVSQEASTLVFSFVGFKTKEVQIEGRSTIDVTLDTDVQQLSDVVVVGFGSTTKKDLTGNVASVSGDELDEVTVGSVEQAIQGRAAGVFVNSNNGKLGQAIQLRIRGTSSLTASAQPLYVIDGIPVTTESFSQVDNETNPMADFNYSDVESIEILKDASAAAIYGSRASNGVILITTKQGSAGPTQFDLNYTVGTSEPSGRRGFLDAAQYRELFGEAFDNSAGPGGTLFGFTFNELFSLDLPGFNENFDSNWSDQPYQDNTSQTLELKASGGTEDTRFYISGGAELLEGILIDNALDRYSGRINLDHSASEKFDIGFKLSLTRSEQQRLSSDNAFSTPMQLVAQVPVQPIYNDNGELNRNTLYFNGLLYRDGQSFNTTVFHSLGSAYLDYDILPNLSLRTEFGIDLIDQNEERWFGPSVARNTGFPEGLATNRWVRNLNWTTQTYANYRTTIAGSHNIDATAGISFQEVTTDRAFVEGINLPTTAFQQVASAAEVTAGTADFTSYNFVGYFARANYDYNDTYLLSLSGRIDGSSRFGENNRYGFFPSASVGWILSNESFLEEQDLITFLKAKASVGVTGNAEINNFASLGLFGANSYSAQSGLNPSQSPNPDLKWENTVQYNFGVEVGLLQDRISAQMDYYIKNTDDLLLNVNVPGTTGFTTQLRNTGKLENTGFEFVLNTYNLTGDFTWSTNLNFAINDNEVTDLNGQVIEGGFINRAVEGQPIGVFFAREYAGVNSQNGDAIYFLNREPTQDEIDNGIAYQLSQFGDRYVVGPDDFSRAERVVIGNPNPDWTGGIGNRFSYKGFDLNVLFQFVVGTDVYNGGGTFMSCNACFYDNQTEKQMDRWQEPGDVTDVPQARLFQSNGDGESSRYLEDASYLRLKTMTLGYNLPSSLLEKASLRNMRIYVTGQNLLTFTGYSGWDPEVNTDFIDGNIALGTDFYAAPQPRSITFGVNVGF
ncbi:MAG TPA: TonB-dependent receptor [Halalkalibaculum sp.]|nr:TonB-dependent receptor [Halalkalibaculum sp.]